MGIGNRHCEPRLPQVMVFVHAAFHVSGRSLSLGHDKLYLETASLPPWLSTALCIFTFSNSSLAGHLHFRDGAQKMRWRVQPQGEELDFLLHSPCSFSVQSCLCDQRALGLLDQERLKLPRPCPQSLKEQLKTTVWTVPVILRETSLSGCSVHICQINEC